MSVPELPSDIYSPEEMFKYSLRRVYILIDYLLSELTKSQDRLHTLFNSMVAQYQNSKLQMQPQAVSGSDIYISNVTPHKIVVSAYLDPDLSAGLDYVQGIT